MSTLQLPLRKSYHKQASYDSVSESNNNNDPSQWTDEFDNSNRNNNEDTVWLVDASKSGQHQNRKNTDGAEQQQHGCPRFVWHGPKHGAAGVSRRYSSRKVFLSVIAGSVVVVSLLNHVWNNYNTAYMEQQLSGWMSKRKNSSASNDQTIPTLLSLLHPETNSFLYALDNELYNKLSYLKNELLTKPQKLLTNERSQTNAVNNDFSKLITEPPQILLSTTQLLYHHPLLVWWSLGSTALGEPLVTDDAVMILSCGSRNENNDNDNIDPTTKSWKEDQDYLQFVDRPNPASLTNRVILEAATINQVKATSALHKQQKQQQHQGTNRQDLFLIDFYSMISPPTETTTNTKRSSSQFQHNRRLPEIPDPILPEEGREWYIPSFPVVRQEACQFLLYKEEEEDDVKESSSFVVSEDEMLHRDGDGHHNHRHPSYTLLASSPLFFFNSLTTPTAIHLAVTNDPSEMSVSFTTSLPGTPVVVYSTSLDSVMADQKVEGGVSDTYEATDMCEAPANQTDIGKFQAPGMLHTVTINNLKPNTKYYYKVGLMTGQGVTWAPEQQEDSEDEQPTAFWFLSALPKGDTSAYSYLVYGDQGCPARGWGYGGEWTSALAAREVHINNNISSSHLPIRAVHHFGDLAYAQGAAHIWDEWFAMIQPFSVHVPLMVAVGNHEYDHNYGGSKGKDPSGVLTDNGYQPIWGNFHNDSGGECGVPVSKRFHMPETKSTSLSTKKISTSNGVFWYSYDYGSVHTTVLSSEHDMSPGSPQYQWLLNDFQSVDRTVTPWLIVELHRPLYEAEAEWANNAVGIAMRMEIEELLYDYNVDVVLAGHYHAYHRTCDGLFRSKCNNGGPMHITVGSAGAHLDEMWLFWTTWTEKFIMHEYGYGRMTVSNTTHLQFEFVKAGNSESDPAAGAVEDAAWIVRNYPRR